MSNHERILALSNSLVLVQGTINKILQAGFAGHQKELEANLARIMGMICILDNQGEIDLTAIQDITGKTITDVMNEINFKYHISNQSPEVIRKTFHIVDK